MTMQHHAELESRTTRLPKVLRVRLPTRVARPLTIDLFANAELRWLCRAGATPRTWIVGIQRVA